MPEDSKSGITPRLKNTALDLSPGDLSSPCQLLFLLLIIIIAGSVPFSGRTPGIMFIDEMFFLHGARLLSENKSLSVPASEIFEHGRPGQFCIPGRSGRLYSQNPIGLSLLLASLDALGDRRLLFNANLLLFPILLLMLHALFRKWFDPSIAITGVFLFAVSPVVALYSTLVMTHTLSLLLQIASLLFLLNRNHVPSKAAYLAGGFVAGLGLLVRLDAILMLIPLTVFTLFPLSEKLAISLRLWRNRLIMLLVALLGFSMGVTPQFAYQKAVFGRANHSGYRHHLEEIKPLSVDRIPANLPRGLIKIQLTAMPLTATAGIIGFIYLLVSRPHTAIHLGTWGLPFFFFYLSFFAGPKNTFNLRYFIPVFPALAASAAALMFNAFSRQVRRILIPVLLTACGILNLQSGFSMVSSRNGVINKQRMLINHVNRIVPPGATVFMPHPEAMMMDLMGTVFDVRESDYLWSSDLPSPSAHIEKDAQNSSGPGQLIRVPKDRLQRTIPDLLPRLLSEKHLIYVACSDVNADFLARFYNVTIVRIAPIDYMATGESSGIFRIDPAN